MKKRQGFTLIELLVVIALIGVLATIGIEAFIASQQQGRNARRVSDLKTIQNALESYTSNNSGSYPANCNFGAQQSQYFPQGFPTDPTSHVAYTPYAGSCTGSAYCFCTQLEGNGVTSGNSAAADCSKYQSGSYFCVQNLQ